MNPEIVFLVQCLLTDGFGPATTRGIWRALEREGLPTEAIHQESMASLAELTRQDQALLQRLRANEQQARMMIEVLQQKRIELISWRDERYPVRLARARGVAAPTLLMVQGDPAMLLRRGIAIGGSREPSSMAVLAAEQIAGIATSWQRTVISGGARGTDLAAHLATLKVGGATVVVVPQGMLTYSAPRAISSAVAEGKAVVVSEFAPLLPWSGWAAIQRNKTVVGLAETFVVAEAGLEGGTRSAANDAIRMSVPVGVCQYPPEVGSFPGNADLIKHGAIPVQVSGRGEVDKETLTALVERGRQPREAVKQRLEGL